MYIYVTHYKNTMSVSSLYTGLQGKNIYSSIKLLSVQGKKERKKERKKEAKKREKKGVKDIFHIFDSSQKRASNIFILHLTTKNIK